MKKILLLFVLAFGLMSVTSSNKIVSENVVTPESYCTAVSEQAVYNYSQNNPNATMDDLFSVQVESYSTCMVIERIKQIGNF